MIDYVDLSLDSRTSIIALLRNRIDEISRSINAIPTDSPMYVFYVDYLNDLVHALSEINHE